MKLGVVWSGGFRLDGPQGWDAVNERRNVPLDVFARALGDDFFSLLKGDPAEAEYARQFAQFYRKHKRLLGYGRAGCKP